MVAKLNVFRTAAEKLQEVNTLARLRNIVERVQDITTIIHSQIPELKTICHCGAIDTDENLLVIYVNNNGAFYKVNQCIGIVQDTLYANGESFDKIIVKVIPANNKLNTQKKLTKTLTTQQINSWNKIATLISHKEIIMDDKISKKIEETEDWEIKI